MPSVVIESWENQGSADGVKPTVYVQDAETFNDVLAALNSAMPAAIGPFVLNKLEQYEQIPGIANFWKCRISYARVKESEYRGQLKDGENRFKFNSVKRSVKRTISYSSTCFDSSGAPMTSVPDLYLIGYKPGSGDIEGITETESMVAFGWRVAVKFSTASESWRRNVANLENTLNQSSFFGYPAETVRFDSISGDVSADGLYVFEMNFEYMPVYANLTIAGTNFGDVNQWHYIDIDYGKKIAEVSGKKYLTPYVRRLKIHRTKLTKDWSIISTVLGM